MSAVRLPIMSSKYFRVQTGISFGQFEMVHAVAAAERAAETATISVGVAHKDRRDLILDVDVYVVKHGISCLRVGCEH